MIIKKFTPPEVDCSYRVDFIQFNGKGIFNTRFSYLVLHLLKGKKERTWQPSFDHAWNVRNYIFGFLGKSCCLSGNKLKLCFPKIKCPCEVILEPFNNLSTVRPEVLAVWLMKYKTKTWVWKCLKHRELAALSSVGAWREKRRAHSILWLRFSPNFSSTIFPANKTHLTWTRFHFTSGWVSAPDTLLQSKVFKRFHDCESESRRIRIL